MDHRYRAAVPGLGELLGDVEGFDDVRVPGALAYVLRLPPEHAARGGAPRLIDDLDWSGALVVAGAGVLRARAVDGLRALARAALVPIANTFGAKGVLRWDDAAHAGTIGLQARDLELLGIHDSTTTVTTGLEEGELGTVAHAVALEPSDLADVAAQVVSPAPRPPDRSPLYRRLAAIVQPGYEDTTHPLHPARAVSELRRRTPPGGVVTAQPGPAGLWVARTFPTEDPGQVVVPSEAVPGVAAAAALAAARRGIPATVVTAAPPDDATQDLAARAGREGVPLTLEVWGDEVDWSRTALLEDAAGPVVTWQ